MTALIVQDDIPVSRAAQTSVCSLEYIILLVLIARTTKIVADMTRVDEPKYQPFWHLESEEEPDYQEMSSFDRLCQP
jgi:hypothetical protein